MHTWCRATGPANATAVVAAPLHTVWLLMLLADGVGFTVMSNVTGVPDTR